MNAQRTAYTRAYARWRDACVIPAREATLRRFGGYCARLLARWESPRTPASWVAAAAYLAEHPYAIPAPPASSPHGECF